MAKTRDIERQLRAEHHNRLRRGLPSRKVCCGTASSLYNWQTSRPRRPPPSDDLTVTEVTLSAPITIMKKKKKDLSVLEEVDDPPVSHSHLVKCSTSNSSAAKEVKTRRRRRKKRITKHNSDSNSNAAAASVSVKAAKARRKRAWNKGITKLFFGNKKIKNNKKVTMIE